jgi:tetratricopeptide (TPR) repeat protein
MSVRGNISVMMSRLGKIAGAIFVVLPIFAPAVAAQTTDSKELERYAEIGQKALEEGRYPEAEAAFEKLRELSPGTAEVHANLGAIYFQEKKFEKAVGALRQALKLRANLPKTESLLAMSLSELGKYSEATPGLEKCFRHSIDPELKRMCGLQLLRAETGLKQENTSVALALELNRLYPDDPEILYHSGRVFGNFAYLSVKRLAEVAPASIWKHQATAEAWESQGSYDLAISEYRQVLSLDPRRPGIHYRLGRVLFARGAATNSQEDTVGALKEFSNELELDPTNANAAYELAETYRNSGEMEEAEKFFRLALQHYPDFDQANLGLAAVLLKEEKPEAARGLIQRAITTDPEDEVAWYRLAQVERALGDEAGQRKAFAEFQRLHQKSAELDAAKGMYTQTDVTKQKVDGPTKP